MSELLRRKLQTNIKKIFAFSFFSWFLIIIPVIVPFFKSRGLNMKEILELQAIFAITVLLLEVPSGYLADLWGRKKTLILGGLFSGLGGLVLPFAHGFWELALFEVLLGIGVSMKSGTDLSMLYDSLYALSKKQDSQAGMVGKMVFLHNISETIASVLGGIIAIYSLDATAAVYAVFMWMPFLIALTLIEPPRMKMKKSEHKQNFKEIFVHIFLENSLLRLIFVNMVLWSSATLVIVWIYQHIWQEMKIPLHAFGWLWALSNLSIGLVARKAHLIEDRLGSFAVVLLIGLSSLLGFVGLATVTHLWGLVFILFFSLSRGLYSVVLKDALNTRVPAKFRATANSASSLGMRFLFTLLAPLAGYLIDTRGTSSALTLLSFFYTGVFVFALIPLLTMIRKQVPGSNSGS